MHQTIRGQGFAAVELKRSAVEIRHFAACLFNDQHPRSRIPGIEIELPESVETSAGHAAQVQGRRTRAPHTVGAQSDLVIEVNIRVLVPLWLGKPVATRHSDRFAIFETWMRCWFR